MNRKEALSFRISFGGKLGSSVTPLSHRPDQGGILGAPNLHQNFSPSHLFFFPSHDAFLALLAIPYSCSAGHSHLSFPATSRRHQTNFEHPR
jgi:hypothetical protein